MLAYSPTLSGDIARIVSAEGQDDFAYDFLDRLVGRKSTTGFARSGSRSSTRGAG